MLLGRVAVHCNVNSDPKTWGEANKSAGVGGLKKDVAKHFI